MRQFLDAGNASCLVLVGEPGIGKTTLWEEGAERARAAGSLVLGARGSESEARLSFVGLADLLDGFDTGVLADLPPMQRRALDVAIGRAEPGGTEPDLLAIASGFLGALRLLSRQRQVVIAFDDIHWADTASAGVLAFVARRLADREILFLLSRRSEGPSDLERAFAPGRVERFGVEPLSFGAINRLLFERLGRPLPRRVLRQVFETSRGNPLFALELGRAIVERGVPEIGAQLPLPDLLDDLFAARVSGLDPPVRRLLLAVALDGSSNRSRAAAIVDAPALDDALDAGLLVAERSRLRASHPLLAAAVVRGSTARERHALHLELAELISDPVLRARHRALAATAPDEGLSAQIAEAVAVASERGAAQDACFLADHALRLTPPDSREYGDRLLRLARCLHTAGDYPRATELLATSLERLPAGRARAEAHLLLGEAAGFDDDGRHLEHALAEGAADPSIRARALAGSSMRLSAGLLERIPEAEALALEALAAAQRAEPEGRAHALKALAWARVLHGRSIDDLRDAPPAVSLGLSFYEVSIERPAGVRHAFRGELDEAREVFGRALVLADERGEARSGLVITTQLGELELRAGNLPEATRLLGEWRHWAGLETLVEAELVYARLEAVLAAVAGVPKRAMDIARTVIDRTGPGSGLAWNHLEALRASGIASLLDRDPKEAAARLRPVWDHTVREGIDDPGAFPVAGELVEALVELGEAHAADEVVGRLRRLAVEQRHPWGLATAMRCEAILRLDERYTTDDAAALDEASSAYARLGLHFDQGRSLLALGRLQRRANKRTDARATLTKATASFEQIGATGWAEEARSELARVSGRKPAADSELTPSEQRVAELARAGLSNKEIAARLFVSVYTVETHLKSAYAKLGIRSRTQLAGRLS